MSSYIKSLIKKGEHQQQDFKYCISDSLKIAKSLSAFANTDGGRLLIGVKDNGAIAGVRTDEEYYMVEAAAQIYCKPEVNFEAKSHSVEGKTVFEVYVPKSKTIPHLAKCEDGKWKAYLRVDDQNLLANKIQIQVWKKLEKKEAVLLKYTDNEKTLLNYLKENPSITMSKYCKISQLPRRKAEKVFLDLILLKIVKIVFTEKQIFYTLDEDEYERHMNNAN
ncbi:MAG: ATP-binding protein [Bacteroidia bacterium]|nr:MAG: ATP-binding protein [Bacteroidia bacterium]PIE86225.1 MAG: ATP-binding protein [Bacteroidia bacterium]